MNYSVYLAGPIRGITYGESVDWRVDVAEKFMVNGIISFSPMRYKEGFKQDHQMGFCSGEGIIGQPKGITVRDRMDVMRCGLVFVNFVGADKASIGTCIELGWADAFRKPIVIAMEEDNVHQHAIVNEIAGFIVPSLDEAIAVTKKILLP